MGRILRCGVFVYDEITGYIVSQQVAKLETNVYDINAGKLLSDPRCRTPGWMRRQQDRLISDFIGVMVKRMTKDGLIPAAEKK